MPNSLPTHAHLIALPSVWMEGEALRQLAQVAQRPGCCRAVGMPDLHPGRGIPVGAVFAFRDRIHPALVGGDAGCGARVMLVRKSKFKGDALLRRIETHTQGVMDLDVDPQALFEAAWTHGAAGLAEVEGLPAGLADLADVEPEWVGVSSGPVPEAPRAGLQLGTTGGGNHFLEVSRVTRVADAEAARVMGVRNGQWAVVAHSGSRGLGGILAERWHGAVLDSPESQALWWADLAGACRYAQANRLILAWRMLSALGAAKSAKLTGGFDVIHNTVITTEVDGAPAFVHRKGAAPADVGQPTVVLGSRGALSWIMRGAGCEASLCSVAHGAGRRMGRAEAVAKLRGKYTRAGIRRTAEGGHVLCDDPQLLFAEHPDAYKPVEPVVASLEAAGAATRVAALMPWATVKHG